MTHKFLPPENVNYSLPFRFVLDDCKEGTVYSCDNFHEAEVTINWVGKEYPCTYRGSAIKGFIQRGDWLVIDDSIEKPVEKPLGEFFKFETKHGTCVCTYLKQASGNPVISWANTSTMRYTEKDCRANIESGEWTVLPSTSTPEQSSENAFKVLEDVVRNHKRLNMGNGSKVVFATGEEDAWESSEPPVQTLQGIVQEYVGKTVEGLSTNIISDGTTVYFINRVGKDYSIKFQYKNPNPTTFAEAME